MSSRISGGTSLAPVPEVTALIPKIKFSTESADPQPTEWPALAHESAPVTAVKTFSGIPTVGKKAA
eukprot:1157449-Pelagomonas_calceolata.AAC.7